MMWRVQSFDYIHYNLGMTGMRWRCMLLLINAPELEFSSALHAQSVYSVSRNRNGVTDGAQDEGAIGSAGVECRRVVEHSGGGDAVRGRCGGPYARDGSALHHDFSGRGREHTFIFIFILTKMIKDGPHCPVGQRHLAPPSPTTPGTA
ncbi:hypothetical protein ACLB2K_047134 [Fragaria x ananassa]